MVTRHGIGNLRRGVLLTGESGIGKSEAALELRSGATGSLQTMR